MKKQNCWEFMECGRGPGGDKIGEMGICPAATLVEADGFLGGVNGGRACCYVAGTFCGGEEQGTHAQKQHNCFSCDFYRYLLDTHGVQVNASAFFKFVKQRKEQDRGTGTEG